MTFSLEQELLRFFSGSIGYGGTYLVSGPITNGSGSGSSSGGVTEDGGDVDDGWESVTDEEGVTYLIDQGGKVYIDRDRDGVPDYAFVDPEAGVIQNADGPVYFYFRGPTDMNLEWEDQEYSEQYDPILPHLTPDFLNLEYLRVHEYRPDRSRVRWIEQLEGGQDDANASPEGGNTVEKGLFVIGSGNTYLIVTATFGTFGNDMLSGGGILSGAEGNDGLTGGAGADILDGGTGNDWLDGGAGADLMNGEDGWDVVSYQSATSGVTVDLTSNVNAGAAAGDKILNIEVLQGSNHNDTLTGIDHGNGHGVQLYGEGGDDGLIGKGGGDYLFGGAGNDWLDGGAGGDVLNGGEGWNMVSYQSATSGVAVDMASNANGGAAAGDTLSNIEVVQGSNFDDSLVGVDRGGGNGVELHGEGGNDNMRGAAGGDRLYGGAGNDWIAGLAGTDLVHGGDGDDIVGGQEGNDTLGGGYGQDELWGGSGADIFLFDTAVGAGADRLKDFSAAEGDMIMLNHNVFSALGVGLLGSAFKVGAATSSSHHILYNSSTGDLSYDYDGSGSAAAVKIATLNPGTALSAFNFFVV
jgi:Ca2+-binding RTX toxin-like protein